MKGIVPLLFTLLLFGANSQAAVTIDFVESGGDVVATSSGTIITTGLTNPSELFTTSGYVAGTGTDASLSCVFLVGTDPSEADAFFFTNWTNDNTDVCSIGTSQDASSGSGNFVGVFSRNGATDGIYIPNNYVSGSPIAGTSTWAGATFASLGLIPGTYVFTFGAGAEADSITLNIGGVVAPPPPPSAPPGGPPSATPVPTMSEWAMLALAALLSLAVYSGSKTRQNRGQTTVFQAANI